jgi:DNA-binding MarR family transcriptional regulator
MHANLPLPPRGSCTCSKVRGLARRLTGMYDAALAPHGLTVTQYAALVAVARAEGALAVADLAQRLQMDRTTTSRLVGPLERAGLVARVDARKVRNEKMRGDARTRPLQLTAKGERRLRSATPAWQDVQSRVDALLGARLQATLTQAADAAGRALSAVDIEAEDR